jgi:peptide-methionine (S)-S-oxide reductase|tara:strand:+ start:418 stop:993 length:576 start_codon:yes stop_codon:yes gene_type:complete
VKKINFFIIFFILHCSFSFAENSKAYFGGGCFWCMEEAFEKKNGVKEVISGYSGGTTENPTYEDVTYGNTGHFETIEIIYDQSQITFEELVNLFWINIDPFDQQGQFCDKGFSYRSVAFYQNDDQKKVIENSKREIEKKFNSKVVTYIRDFKKFYKAEENHQDYYEKKFINYLLYKKGCGREKRLNNIWKS